MGDRAELTPKPLARTVAIMRGLLARTSDYGPGPRTAARPVMARSSTWPPRRLPGGVWPDEARLSLWVLPPRDLSVLLFQMIETGDGAAAYYGDVMQAAVSLALAAPCGPPSNATDFLERFCGNVATGPLGGARYAAWVGRGDVGQLRMLHWNIHSWRDASGAPNHAAVAAVIRRTAPDVVSLVEVQESWGIPSAAGLSVRSAINGCSYRRWTLAGRLRPRVTATPC